MTHNHLCGFLQEELLLKVKKEADQAWALSYELEIPKSIPIKRPIAPLSAGIYNLVRQFLP